MRAFMAITKALADENRVRILSALEGKELCVCQLIALLGLAPSTVSKHISVLRQAGLLEWRKEGRWVLYSLAREEIDETTRRALSWTLESVASSKQIKRDSTELRKILEKDREEACKLYGQR